MITKRALLLTTTVSFFALTCISYSGGANARPYNSAGAVSVDLSQVGAGNEPVQIPAMPIPLPASLGLNYADAPSNDYASEYSKVTALSAPTQRYQRTYNQNTQLRRPQPIAPVSAPIIEAALPPEKPAAVTGPIKVAKTFSPLKLSPPPRKSAGAAQLAQTSTPSVPAASKPAGKTEQLTDKNLLLKAAREESAKNATAQKEAQQIAKAQNTEPSLQETNILREPASRSQLATVTPSMTPNKKNEEDQSPPAQQMADIAPPPQTAAVATPMNTNKKDEDNQAPPQQQMADIAPPPQTKVTSGKNAVKDVPAVVVPMMRSRIVADSNTNKVNREMAAVRPKAEDIAPPPKAQVTSVANAEMPKSLAPIEHNKFVELPTIEQAPVKEIVQETRRASNNAPDDQPLSAPKETAMPAPQKSAKNELSAGSALSELLGTSDEPEDEGQAETSLVETAANETSFATNPRSAANNKVNNDMPPPPASTARVADAVTQKISKTAQMTQVENMPPVSMSKSLQAENAPMSKNNRLLYAAAATDVSDSAAAPLNQWAEKMIDDPRVHVQVKSYASKEQGSSSEARRISMKRGLAVRNYLVDKGVPSNRIDVRALGYVEDAVNPPDRVDILAM